MAAAAIGSEKSKLTMPVFDLIKGALSGHSFFGPALEDLEIVPRMTVSEAVGIFDTDIRALRKEDILDLFTKKIQLIELIINTDLYTAVDGPSLRKDGHGKDILNYVLESGDPKVIKLLVPIIRGVNYHIKRNIIKDNVSPPIDEFQYAESLKVCMQKNQPGMMETLWGLGLLRTYRSDSNALYLGVPSSKASGKEKKEEPGVFNLDDNRVVVDLDGQALQLFNHVKRVDLVSFNAALFMIQERAKIFNVPAQLWDVNFKKVSAGLNVRCRVPAEFIGMTGGVSIVDVLLQSISTSSNLDNRTKYLDMLISFVASGCVRPENLKTLTAAVKDNKLNKYEIFERIKTRDDAPELLRKVLDDKESPFGQLFRVQRGFSKPSQTSGVLKDVGDYLASKEAAASSGRSSDASSISVASVAEGDATIRAASPVSDASAEGYSFLSNEGAEPAKALSSLNSDTTEKASSSFLGRVAAVFWPASREPSSVAEVVASHVATRD